MFELLNKKVHLNYLFIIIAMLCVTGFFTARAFIIGAQTTEIKERIKTEQDSIDAFTNKKPDYTPEELQLIKLRQELEMIQTQNAESIYDTNGLDSFLTRYDNAMDLDFYGVSDYSVKQATIKEQLSPFFTEEAFKNTHYYTLMTLPEYETMTGTHPVSGAVLEGKKSRTILESNREDIYRKFMYWISENKVKVILMIDDKFYPSQWKYQYITVEKENGSFIITEYQSIKADYVK